MARYDEGEGKPSQTAKLFEGERWLVLTGLLGFVLAAGCGIWVLLFGGQAAPDGDVSKAISFNAALGLFLLSTAAISPISGLGRRSRTFFRWFYIALALYSYAAETVQNFRGVNPRFVKDGTSFDMAVGSMFAAVALLLVAVYLFIAVPFFRRKAYDRRPELVLGVRYAMVAVMLSFAAGIWISLNEGRYVGASGNLIWLHGLGFHALQAIPLVGWLSERTALAGPTRRAMVHLSGFTFLLGLAAIAVQTYLGSPLWEWSIYPIIACECFLISLATGCVMLGKSEWLGLSADGPRRSSSAERKG